MKGEEEADKEDAEVEFETLEGVDELTDMTIKKDKG